MAVHIFQLQGCTDANLVGVQAALVRIAHCTIYRTAGGAFILRVEADDPPDGQVQAFLAPLHVAAVEAMGVPFQSTRG